jgi:hypothetical protein
MTKEDIIRMATEAYKTCDHIPNLKIPKEFIERFAALVASAEREACAKLCAKDGVQAMDFTGGTFVGGYFAKKIIARGDS